MFFYIWNLRWRILSIKRSLEVVQGICFSERSTTVCHRVKYLRAGYGLLVSQTHAACDAFLAF